jgi:hypothetical protein
MSEHRIEAKRAFVLSDRLTAAPFDNIEIFLTVLNEEKSRIQVLSVTELDSIIGRDRERLHNYNVAVWKFDKLQLGSCFVWPEMGRRAWAQGTVCEVAEKFKRLEPLNSRVWNMKLFSSIFEGQLPIVVLRKNSKFQIDDGSHRAIAMALSGIQTVSAWTGTLG